MPEAAVHPIRPTKRRRRRSKTQRIIDGLTKSVKQTLREVEAGSEADAPPKTVKVEATFIIHLE